MAVIHSVLTSWFTLKYFLVSLYFYLFLIGSLFFFSLHVITFIVIVDSTVELPLMATSQQWSHFFVPAESLYIHSYFKLSTMATATKAHRCQENLLTTASLLRTCERKSHFLLCKVTKLEHFGPPLVSVLLIYLDCVIYLCGAISIFV